MAAAEGHGHSVPSWFLEPGEGDLLAWVAIGIIIAALYGLVTLYAAFDRWAEQRSHGTPLAKTIPTMLTIALLYEIFPLGHFNILLPISAILIALMADWSRFHLNARGTVGQAAIAEDGPSPSGSGASHDARATGETGHA